MQSFINMQLLKDRQNGHGVDRRNERCKNEAMKQLEIYVNGVYSSACTESVKGEPDK